MKKMKYLTLLVALTCMAEMQAQNVASIGSDEYATLTEALAAWEEGDTLTLLADVEITDEITVMDKTVTLDLNGYGITQTAAKKSILVVNPNGDLSLIDSQPERSTRRFRVDAIDKVAILDDGGDRSFTGGYLYGGKGVDGGFEEPNRGGAVNIYNGTFTMKGGTILGNQSQFGGAVAVVYGTFLMSGGRICYNANTRHTFADQGGSAVWVQSDNRAQFMISGTALIEHNYSFRDNELGAQVVIFGVNGMVDHYPFTVVGGTPKIINGENGWNVMLADGNVIRVAGKMLTGAEIGVVASDAPRTFTSNYSFQNYDAQPSAYFVSDNDSYIVALDAPGKEAILLAYVSENDDDITAKLDQWIGKTISMKIQRTFGKNGMYHTVCLPFSLDNLTGTPLEGGQLYEFYSTTIDVNPTTGVQQLRLIIKTAPSVEAGIPYLIRWANTGEEMKELLFSDVYIETSVGKTVTDKNGGEFIGHMAKEHIDDDAAHSKLFVGINNTLYWPASGDVTSMKGFRAYFSMPNGVTINQNVIIPGMLATLTIGFGSEEGVEEVRSDKVQSTKVIENGVLYLEYEGQKYDVQGVRVY